MRKAILGTAVAAALTIAAGSAEAAAPPLSLTRADQAAQKEIHATIQAWAAAYDPSASDPSDPGSQVYIASYVLDPCDAHGPSAAVCDVTYTLNDSTQCDSTIHVRTTRRDRLSVRQTDIVCDGDPSY